MPAYLIEISRVGMLKANQAVVTAANATDAKAIARQRFSGVADEAWDAATPTLLAAVLSSTASALVGWTFKVTISTPAGAILEEVSFTADATDDQLDEIGAALVVLLTATASITLAAYAANVLTVAEIADGIGDHKLDMLVTPPVILDGNGDQENQDSVNIPGFVGTIVDEGIAAAVLTVAFAIDAYEVPTVYAMINGDTV